jgi:gluconate 2-dehydrogenase gamma chain
MVDHSIARRNFLKGAGAAGTAAAAALTTGSLAHAQEQASQPQLQTQQSPPPTEPLHTLTPTEAAFFSAAYDTFIPADQFSPSGTDCGLVVYIDRQLAGAWGTGAKFYRSGPFVTGKPEQGYQLNLTPREYFGAGIAAANEWSRRTYGKDFDRLDPATRDTALKAMDAGKADFVDVNGKYFFDLLYQSAMEGFFADPIYGGNRDKVSWKMVGYPGLPATYASKAEEYRGKKINLPPQSIADLS